MVLVAVDCPDAYARLSLDVSSDNPASISSLSVVGDHRYERLPISEFLGFIRIPFSFFVANPVRVVLRGRVSHVDDRLQPECAIEREMSINVNAMLTYRVTKPALAAWSQARSVVCSPSFMTNVLNENSEFEVEVSAPKEIGAIFSVNMTYSGTSDASPLLTVRKAIEVIVDKPRSYPGGQAPVFSVEPVEMLPAVSSRRRLDATTSLGGTLVSVQAKNQNLTANPSVLIIEITSSTYVTQFATPTTEGTFSFGAVEKGVYQLRVLPGPGLLTLRVVESVRVRFDESDLVISVAFVERDSRTTQMVLMPHGALNTAINLHLAFGSSFGATNGTDTACHVFEGRKTCGGATWDGSSSGGQQVALPESLPVSSKFDVFVAADRQLCSGYGRASSSLLPGGRDEGVDCVGSCSTGRSYCYAANAGLCASCVLWDPVGDEVLCYSFGTPQGGPLPGTSEWGDDCAATSSADAEEANALSTNLTSFSCACPVFVAPALSLMLLPPQLGQTRHRNGQHLWSPSACAPPSRARSTDGHQPSR